MKQVIIRALYHYLHTAPYIEKINCLNMFGCEPWNIDSDPEKICKSFEYIIEEAVEAVDYKELT